VSSGVFAKRVRNCWQGGVRRRRRRRRRDDSDERIVGHVRDFEASSVHHKRRFLMWEVHCAGVCSDMRHPKI
jgi:hypothetical protein